MKKVKRILGTAAGLLAGLLLGLVLGGVMGDDAIALYNRGYSDMTVMLIMLAVLYFAYFVQVIFHEAGHLVFGLLSGYRFASFRILSFVWMRENGRLRMKRYRIPGTLGQCLMDPPEMVDGKYPSTLYHMGGALMDLIVFVVCAGLWYVLAWRYWMAGVMVMYLAAQAGWALFSALRNGIPINGRLVSNDGYNALKLRGNPEALRAMWIQLKYAAESSRGVSTLNMPEKWFEMPTDEQMQNRHVAWLALLRVDRLYAEQRLEEAASLVDHLMKNSAALDGINRYLLTCEKMFLETVGENNPDVVEGLRTKEQLSFMKRMRTGLTVLRAEYACAVLVKQDEAQAKKIRADFEKAGKTYPYPAAFECERQLMDLVDQRAAERQA